MRQVLLAILLIMAPVALFWGGHAYMAPTASAAANLGDLSKFKTIVSDVQSIAVSGDFVGAEKRITDFETEWDGAESGMKPMNPDAWKLVDRAADAAYSALRATSPDASAVQQALGVLMSALNNNGTP